MARIHLEMLEDTDTFLSIVGLPWWLEGKESSCNLGDPSLIPCWDLPWRREWENTSVILPGESYKQICLVGYM